MFIIFNYFTSLFIFHLMVKSEPKKIESDTRVEPESSFFVMTAENFKIVFYNAFCCN